MLTLLIIIIEAAAERCSESKNVLVCWEMIVIYSKLRGEIQLLRYHLMTEYILKIKSKKIKKQEKKQPYMQTSQAIFIVNHNRGTTQTD